VSFQVAAGYCIGFWKLGIIHQKLAQTQIFLAQNDVNRFLALDLKKTWRQQAYGFELASSLKRVLILVVYYFFSQFVFNAVPLSESGYRQPVLILEALKSNKTLLVFLGCGLLLVLNYARLAQNPFYGRWNWKHYQAEEGIDARYVVFALALILAWAFSLSEFNFYYNQGHYVDRLLLLVLAGLVLVNPIFATIFVVFAVTFVSQFNYPEILNYSWFDKTLLFKVLLLFGVFNIVGLFVKFRPSHFVFLALCLIGSDYFLAGLSKLTIGNRVYDWVLKNQVHNLFVSSYVNGWVRFLDQPTVLPIAAGMKLFDIPLQLFTLAVELGGLLLVVGRRASILILYGAVLLHVGIFLSSGIFFWKWILLDLSLAILLWKNRHTLDALLFTKWNAILSLLVMLIGYTFLSQTRAGWFDTRVNNFYEFEAVGEDGSVYNIPRGFWAPYDIPFAQDNFYFLNDDKVLAGTYGTQRDAGIAIAVNRAETVAEIQALWEEYGRSRYSEAAAQTFDDFVRTFVRNANLRTGALTLPAFLRPPHHITTFAPENAYEGQSPIQRIRVRYIETFYNGEEIIVLEDKVVREIEISEAE
jgi:hypothetical protein